MPQAPLNPRTVSAPGAVLVTVEGRAYPLKSARIVARAEGGIAHTTLAQEFSNPHAEPLEVLYTMPLPADGAVVGYTIMMGERVIRGEVEKREVARARYEEALFEGRSAGLVEQDRDDTFFQRLGSLPPGQAVKVEIEVLHPLDFVPATSGEPARWAYRFPTVVGVRYEGETGRVGDAERLDVNRAGEGEIPTRVELDLTIADGSPETLQAISATHDIVWAADAGITRVGLQGGARLDRDLVVSWNACGERVGARLVEGRGLAGDDGRYGLLTLTPPSTPDHAFPRDLTVLLDASGSMEGSPIEWAKQVVAELLRSLDPTDRFESIAFADQPRRLDRELIEGTPSNVATAIRWLEALQAGGATEMERAVIDALAPLRQNSQRQVVLVTDGYIGFESRVVGEIRRRLPEGARLHTVGVGAAPNRALTRAVARAGRGVEVFACDEASASRAVLRLCRATARPVLTELSIAGAAVLGLAPGRPRDVLAGQPLTLSLELAPEGGAVEVGARQAGTSERWIWRIVVPASAAPGGGLPATHLPLGALYGRERIADLELEASAIGNRSEGLDARIEAAGLRHRIASRMTSLVAVADEPSVDPKLPRRRERLPVEIPAGVSAEGTGLIRGGLRHAKLASIMGPSPRLRMIGSSLMLGGADLMKQVGAKARAIARSPAPKILIVRVEGARLLRASAGGLTVEFEVPFDGFELPEGEINLWPDGETWLVARVEPGESSPRGPHKSGLTVRLALTLAGHPEWLQAKTIEVRWLARPEGAGRNQVAHLITLTVVNTAGARGPDRP